MRAFGSGWVDSHCGGRLPPAPIMFCHRFTAARGSKPALAMSCWPTTSASDSWSRELGRRKKPCAAMLPSCVVVFAAPWPYCEPTSSPATPSAPWAISWRVMRSSWWWATTWPISWPITAASWSWFFATLKMPVYTPTLPPGSAKALGSSLTNTAVSQDVPCPLSAGSSRISALTTQRTYASWLVSLVCGVLALVSTKACAPIWLSCAWETAPTYWVRPVGEVVVAQPATTAATARPSRSFFMARFPWNRNPGCKAGSINGPSMHAGQQQQASDQVVGRVRADRRPQRAGAAIDPCEQRTHHRVARPQQHAGQQPVAACARQFVHAGERRAAEHDARQRPARGPQAPEQHAPEQQLLVGGRQQRHEQQQQRRVPGAHGLDQRLVGRHLLDANLLAERGRKRAEGERGQAGEQGPAPGRRPARCGARSGALGGAGGPAPEVQQQRRGRGRQDADQHQRHALRLPDPRGQLFRTGRLPARQPQPHALHQGPAHHAGDGQSEYQQHRQQQVDRGCGQRAPPRLRGQRRDGEFRGTGLHAAAVLRRRGWRPSARCPR